MANINKTHPNCALVMVLLDLLTSLPDHVRMDIKDEKSGAIRKVKVNIQYDYLPNYCRECKLQGVEV